MPPTRRTNSGGFLLSTRTSASGKTRKSCRDGLAGKVSKGKDESARVFPKGSRAGGDAAVVVVPLTHPGVNIPLRVSGDSRLSDVRVPTFTVC